MTTTVLELLDWLAREPRTHRQTIDAWGSHCPRATPWEEPRRRASSGCGGTLRPERWRSS